MRIIFGLLPAFLGALYAAPPFQASFDASAKQWQAAQGTATSDSQVQHDRRASLRVEPAGTSDAFIKSTPVDLTVGKSYELSAWVRTENLEVRDLDRSPIATGASVGMASMPFDVHSESLGGTREWAKLNLKFTATRSRDQVVLAVAEGGAFRGKAWFEGVTVEQVASTGDLPQKASLRTFGPGYRYPKAGWIYVHIEGEPYDRGYQHGYLLAHEIEQYIDRCAAQLDVKSRATAWNNGRTSANALFLRGFDQEILQEMKGIADGAAAAGATYNGRTVDLIDIVTLNTITELGELNEAMPMTPTGLEGLGLHRPLEPKPTEGGNDHCSAFAACGKATRDGKMVIGHVTWWPETLAEQTNIMLDVQPTTGHRVLMQSYPGGIQSGTDWYQNDVGVVLTETTIDQSPFNVQGTPVAYRARKSIQYGDSIDKVVELLKTRNNGLYTNEWIIGDARTNEIAMLELGTYKTRLYRSSKNDWFGGTEGFYWGCNNAKDLDVRLEYVPDPHGAPRDLPFVPTMRDVKWQQMYREHKGSIDESFGFLAFRTAPLVSRSTMDAKVTTSEMASQMMTWALFGKPNQREWAPAPGDPYSPNVGLYSSGYKLFQAHAGSSVKTLLTGAPAATVIEASADDGSRRGRGGRRRAVSASKDYLWKGWILPASDADVWLTAGSAAYFDVLNGNDTETELNAYRADFREATLDHDQALSQLKSSTTSADWHTIAEAKGVLFLDALRRSMGDDAFYARMREFYEKNTGKMVHAADFIASVGSAQEALAAKWLNEIGLPDAAAGPIYTASAIRPRLGSSILVYGTLAEAGANRYAAEQWQKLLLNQFEGAVQVYKDFEVSAEDLRNHDVIFVGRPETNSALAPWSKRIALDYEGSVFRVEGQDHASENEALIWTAVNPENRAHMVIVAAGNSPLSTVLLARGGFGSYQYQIADAGEAGRFRIYEAMKLFSVLLIAACLSAADRKGAIDQLVQPIIDAGAAPGIVVGVLEGGKTQVFGYGKGPGGGAPDATTIFEIGSVSKTFTTTALAIMVERKMVDLEDPVRKYLPPDAVPAGAEGDKEIRLIDLATQHSGLPRLPGNMHPKDMTNPYVDYSPKLLYAYLAEHTLKLPPDPRFLYSNLGMGLLGHALSLRYGKSYEQMIVDLVSTPLDLNDTRVTLTADEQKRLAQGYDGDGNPVHTWDLDALAGAGALRSDANDLLRYLQAHLNPPEKLKAAMEIDHQERHKIGAAGSIALAWLIKPDGKTYSHDGGTGGYSTFVTFNTERKTGVVVLINSAGSLMDQIGDRVDHILAGETVQPLPVHRAVTLDAKALDEYPGSYEVIAGVQMTITKQGDQLGFRLPGQPPGQPPVGLYAEAKDRFFVRVTDATVTFDRNEQGQIVACVLHQNGRETKGKRVP